MEITCTIRDRNLFVKINGEIDHHTAETIRNKVDNEYRRSNARNIIFDFDEVSFMDSSGIGMIIGRYKNIEEHGGKVVVSSVSESLGKIFELSGLQKIIPIFGSKEAAADSLSLRRA